MKNIASVALLLLMSAAAQAKPAPVTPLPVIAASPDQIAIATGVTLERDYFQAPESQFGASRQYPCRLHLQIFDKAQMAQTCR